MLNVDFRPGLLFGINCGLRGAIGAKMSADVVNIQAQVETVLGALVKAASVELIKLFESRYRGSPVVVGRAEGDERKEGLESIFGAWNGKNKRSIGVQVEEDIKTPVELGGFACFHCDGTVLSCMMKSVAGFSFIFA